MLTYSLLINRVNGRVRDISFCIASILLIQVNITYLRNKEISQSRKAHIGNDGVNKTKPQLMLYRFLKPLTDV
jgi:hypothetical protein